MSESRPRTDRRPPRTAFKPGHSGNPGGRPKMTEARRLAVKMRGDAQPEVVERLLAIARDKSADVRDRIACLKALLEDPPAQVEVADVTEPSTGQLSKRELIALGLGALEVARRERAASADGRAP